MVQMGGVLLSVRAQIVGMAVKEMEKNVLLALSQMIRILSLTVKKQKSLFGRFL